jgi:hypothetical protein
MRREGRTGADFRGPGLPIDSDAGFPRWLGPVAIVFSFVLLAGSNWGKWPDVHIDFGNELYLARRLELGGQRLPRGCLKRPEMSFSVRR